MVLRVLAGRYEVVRFVGRGGMGEVWEGRDRVIGRRVAIKLLPHDRRDVAGAELFQREARTAGALNHPGVVTVHDFGQDEGDGSLFLVMEFLQGRDLDTALKEDGGPPPVAVAVEWVAQAAAALARAHELDVVHRDLKPANLMLTPDDRVKILDFGIARFMESLPSSRVIGTFPYMPPERFDGHPGDARSDLYSLGCVLHELLTGQLPFQATSPVSMMRAHLTKTPVPPGRVRAGVPAALDDLVMQLLAKAPEDRPTSAAEVRDRLLHLPSAAVLGTGAADTAVRIADARTRTAESAARVDSGDFGTPPRTGFVTRRRALWLGIAATAGAGIATGFALLDNGDRETGSGAKPPTGERPWFTADRSTLSLLVANGGVVYVNGQDTRDGTVYALDAASGATKWSHRVNGGGHTEAGASPSPVASANIRVPSPTVADGAVYADGLDGNLYVLDAATGARNWAYTVGGVRLLTVAGGVVYVYVHHENAVHALDAATGAEKWIAREIGGISSWETVDKVAHAYIDDQHNVQALDAATGMKKWDFTGRSCNGLWTSGGLVYTSGNNDPEGIYALNATTGTQNWQFPTPYSPYPPTTMADGVTYFVGQTKQASRTAVHAVDAATGTLQWSATPEDNNLGGSSLKAADGALYVNGSKETHALNASTGRTKWSIDTTDNDRLELEVADGVVYVNETAGDPHVQALDAATGTKRWTSAIRGSSLLIAPAVLYVTSKDKDAVYALDTATGANRTR
ncbi:serine/threonine-protein kinase [Streptomyces sp. NPDC048473]|uniref:serine/threonine-protein kinase n=1 Tax=Streptomyces sp. NPDC048473 TaxID=3365556 RepID=UPI00372033AE